MCKEQKREKERQEEAEMMAAAATLAKASTPVKDNEGDTAKMPPPESPTKSKKTKTSDKVDEDGQLVRAGSTIKAGSGWQQTGNAPASGKQSPVKRKPRSAKTAPKILDKPLKELALEPDSEVSQQLGVPVPRKEKPPLKTSLPNAREASKTASRRSEIRNKAAKADFSEEEEDAAVSSMCDDCSNLEFVMSCNKFSFKG